MNLLDLKNFDITAYLKGILGSGAGSKRPTPKTLLWSLLGISIFLVYIFFIFLPYLDERSQIQKMVFAIPEMEANIKYLEVANKKAHDELVQTEISYLDLNRRFSTEPELEDLYRKLSQMAATQGLVISSLSTDGEDAIFAGGKALASNQVQLAPVAPVADPAANAANPSSVVAPPAPLFYRVRIKVEMTGGYNRYMRYRKLLAEFGKVVNIDKEQITLVKGDAYGTVSVKSQLSVYKLPQKLQVNKTVSNQIPLVNPQVSHGSGLFNRLFAGWSMISQANAADAVTSAKNGNTVPASNASAAGSPSNERDPFSRSSSGMIEGGRDPRYSPLTMADPQTYVITGVMVSNNAKAAMIKTDFRESFVVKIGDRLGNQGATIADIDLEGVILRQPGGGRLRLYIQSQPGQYPLGDSSKGINGGAR